MNFDFPEGQERIEPRHGILKTLHGVASGLADLFGCEKDEIIYVACRELGYTRLSECSDEQLKEILAYMVNEKNMTKAFWRGMASRFNSIYEKLEDFAKEDLMPNWDELTSSYKSIDDRIDDSKWVRAAICFIVASWGVGSDVGAIDSLKEFSAELGMNSRDLILYAMTYARYGTYDHKANFDIYMEAAKIEDEEVAMDLIERAENKGWSKGRMLQELKGIDKIDPYTVDVEEYTKEAKKLIS